MCGGSDLSIDVSMSFLAHTDLVSHSTTTVCLLKEVVGWGQKTNLEVYLAS